MYKCFPAGTEGIRGRGEQLRLGTAWQGWEFLKRAQEKLLAKVQSSCSEDHGMNTQDSINSGMEPAFH